MGYYTLETNKIEIGSRIKTIRKNKNFSMQKLADLVDVAGKSTINEWEKGRSLPSKEKLQLLAKVLDVNFRYLVFGSFTEFVKETMLFSIDNKTSEKLTTYFFSFANRTHPISKVSDDNNLSAEEQLKLAENLLHEITLKTITETLDDLCEFLLNLGYSYETQETDILNSAADFYKLKAGKDFKTKQDFIDNLIADIDNNIYSLNQSKDLDFNRTVENLVNKFKSDLSSLK